jgi:hypothetical protein
LRRLSREGETGTLHAMDEDPFRVLSRKEFDGLSVDEKLAYLDLELLSAIGTRGRRTDRPTPVNPSASRRSGERRHPGP